MDGMSLGQVVELLDRNLTELSPIDGGRLRHSTPEGGKGVTQGDGGLELVGKGVKTHVKAGAKTTRNFERAKARPSAKSAKVRNYNRK